jgi:hypothetical protein
MTLTLERLIQPGTSIDVLPAREAPIMSLGGDLTRYEVKRRPVSVASLLVSGTDYGTVSDTSSRNFASSLRRIQASTQLDWGQIARTLGVSRRTVHNWLAGMQVNGVNAGRIAMLYRAVVQELGPKGRRDDPRAYLLAPDRTGVTPLARITQYIRGKGRTERLPISTMELLTGPSSEEGPIITGGQDTEVAPVEIDHE